MVLQSQTNGCQSKEVLLVNGLERGVGQVVEVLELWRGKAEGVK